MTRRATSLAGAEILITGAGAGCSRKAAADHRLGRKFRVLAHAALLVAGIHAAAAEEGPVAKPSGVLAFHIPSQPLAAALQAYGQRTGVQVLYESNSAVGRTSVAVEGNFTSDAALSLLLSATDLKVSYSRPDAITLAPPFAVSAVPAPASGSLGGADLFLGTLRVRGSKDGDEEAQLKEYSERVQMDIQNALRKNPKTRDGSYRAVLDLWIDPTRMIERTELFRSTGDGDRDAAIATTLRGVTISRPAPPAAPQPIRVSIVVKSLQ
jgi:hypothetical protein